MLFTLFNLELYKIILWRLHCLNWNFVEYTVVFTLFKLGLYKIILWCLHRLNYCGVYIV